MTTHETEIFLKNLEQEMYGHNYEAHFEIEVIDKCETINEARKYLSVRYNDARLFEVQPKLTNEQYLWYSINYGFEYRGDDVSGLELTVEKAESLAIEAKKYESFIRQYLTETTEIYGYPQDSYVPYVFIFWGYSFILFNIEGESLFINGISTD